MPLRLFSPLLATLLVLAAGCGDSPGAPPSAAPAPPPAPTPESLAIGELRACLLAAIAEAATAAPVIVNDETPRLEVPEKPGPASALVYLPGASAQMPTTRLTGLDLAWTDDGLTLRLFCEDSEATILDRSGSKAGAASYEALCKAALGVRDALWPAVERGVTEAITRAGFDPKAGATLLQTWSATLGRGNARFERRFLREAREGLGLARAALRAGTVGDPKTGPEDLFAQLQLLEVRKAMVGEMGEGGGRGLLPVAAGPCLGLMRGDPGKEPEVTARLDGADGMLITVHVRGLAGAPVPERWRGLIASFRPFATNDIPAAAFERKAADLPPPQATLAALSALLLSPTVERAERLIETLRKARPPSVASVAPGVASEDSALAAQLASRLRLSPPDAERLARYTGGK